ncbi:hypothetical protein FRC04_010916 [Tulasnella sp. 424]|nr:hypothetical protein FRC04_010916 [Tulasnella sp. 424]KAG8975723.1 hypothetical protein FRC05_005241 [Tulasnella sp. 425]
MPPTRDGLKAMKRTQLQRLAKQNRLRGNLKTAELVDLLAQHFEQQQKSSERTAGSLAPSPSPSSHLQDAENREPTPIVVQPIPAPAASMDKLSLQAIGLADIDLTQLSQPNLPASSRLTALETLVTRLISHATSSAATITLLQGRLEAAEQSINNLVTSLEETRTQLGSTQSQLRSLQSSLVASDQLATETATSMTADIDYAKRTAESVGMRLTQAEERWQAELQHLARQVGEPEDKLLFEPPALPRPSSRSRRSKSRETPGPTFAWAQGQQAIVNNGLGLPSVRLFGATSSSATIPEEMELDVEVPGTSTSSSRPQLAPSALPSSVPLSTSWSSSASASLTKKSTSVDSHITQPPESSRITRQASTSRESSRAAGKRPASPIPIPDNPHAEYDNARASKRPRHASGGQQGESSRAAGKRNDDESPSLNSFSAGGSVSTAESPVFPPSPIVEPSTPPSKRPTALLPPIEIISTPSPTSRSQATMAMSMRKEYGDPHGFATAPRPPAEGPASPTSESPRRQMARRFKVELEPPSVLDFPPTSAAAPESARKKQKARERPSTPARGAASTPSPATLLIGKGKVVRASVDPETASAIRSRSASEDADGDTTMTAVPGPSTSVAEGRARSTGASSKQATNSATKRNSSFFGPPTVDFPSSGAYSQLELAPPPPPPHNSNLVVATSSSARRMGSAPLLTAAAPLRVDKPRDYSADPDEEPSTSISAARPARMVNRAATHTTLAAPANLSTVTPSAQRSSWWRRQI